jgi:superoxide reductase
MKMRFFICEHCGNIVEMVKDKGVPVMCCGQKMTELIPGTSDGAVEKHVPVVTVDGNKVSVIVGEVEHPMVDAHYIEWIAIETSKGVQRKMLRPEQAPKAEFMLTDGESVEAVYAYCNLHGLWKAE